MLGQVSSWCATLHDLGEVEVKHGVHLHLYNLYTEEVGSPETPKKVLGQRAESAASLLTRKRTSAPV